jgi:membrane-associated protease RseP (regulator of RpoE activity)
VSLLGLLGVVAFIVALLLSVMLHEAGHFFTARRYGMKATQFFVGFGPTLWSRTKGETEYGVKAIPAGGYVKIVGMTSLEEVAPGDEDRAFYRQPTGRKTVVLAAGSTVHFLITVLLVAGTIAVFGVQRESHPRLAGISACVNDKSTGSCDVAGAVKGPALQSGLKAGDEVLAVDGKGITSSVALVKSVKAAKGRTIQVAVRRAGKELVVPVTPATVLRDTRQVGAIGVTIEAVFAADHVGPVGVVRESGTMIGQLITGTVHTFTEKLGTIGEVYGPNRDPSGFVGVVGVGRISGEIATAPISVSDRIQSFLFVVAGLNLFVGIFNLLPLLPLDGGHIAVVQFEQLRDRVRRLRGYRGDFQRVDMNKLMPLTLAVVVLFVGFTLFLLGADIVNPITLN